MGRMKELWQEQQEAQEYGPDGPHEDPDAITTAERIAMDGPPDEQIEEIPQDPWHWS